MATSIASSLSGANSASPLSTPGPSAIELLKDKTLANKLAKTQANLTKTDNYAEVNKAKAKAASQDFEAVFLNTMFQQMFTGLKGDGPFGGSGATGVWRSFLTDEYSKSFAKSGGIGIADQVYSSLLKQQEIHQ
jgi:flagellar protein FlgJ